MRDAIESEDLVSARLRSVLPDGAVSPPGADGGPHSWKDLIPAGHRGSDDHGEHAATSGSAWSSLPYAWDTLALANTGTASDVPEPTGTGSGPPGHSEGVPVPADPGPISGSGAFGFGTGADRRSVHLGFLDPGRRGVRALAAVAALVVVIAALIAWRSRPRVEPVAEPLAGVSATTLPGAGESVEQASGSAAGVRPSAADVVVAVAGKVRRPGLVRLPPGSRVADAVEAAGGAGAGVDVAMLNPARKVVDGELIVVGIPPPSGAAATVAPATGRAAAPAPGTPVNLNTATLADLDTLPGVGPVLAQRILDARTAQGGFTAVSDLRKVDGIGDARYDQLKDLVVV